MNEPNNEGFSPVSGFDPSPEFGQRVGYRQSKLGIASFIIGLVSVIGFIICVIIAASSIMDYIDVDGNTVQNIEEITSDGSIIAAGLLMVACVAVSLIGLILGIIGACVKQTRKAFSVIGIVLNSILTVGFAGLLIFGLLIQYAS